VHDPRKAEFLNPGGSVKDRPARHMILEAEKRGELRAGGIVVESTAGNTGIGWHSSPTPAGIDRDRDPGHAEPRKKDTLRLCGAELIEVPAVPTAIRTNISTSAGALRAFAQERTQRVLFAISGTILTTARHITRRRSGDLAGYGGTNRRLYCSIGTGGTIAGISTFLGERKRDMSSASPIRRRRNV